MKFKYKVLKNTGLSVIELMGCKHKSNRLEHGTGMEMKNEQKERKGWNFVEDKTILCKVSRNKCL
jgi:hypothetical protein